MPRPPVDKPTFSLTNRKGWFYLQFWFMGQARRVSTRTTSKAEAEVFRQQFMADFDPEHWSRPVVVRERVEGVFWPPSPLTPASMIKSPVDLETEASIVSRSETAPRSGVYFLIKDEKVVYVGQARNVLSRIGEHVGYKDFDAWTWIATSIERLDCVEAAYIAALKPALNIDSRSAYRRRMAAMRNLAEAG